MKSQRLFAWVSWGLVMVLAMGCSAVYSQALPTATPALVASPTASDIGPIVGSSVSSGGATVSGDLSGSSATPGPLVTPTPLTLDATGNLSVGLADNGGAVLLQVGQRFLLNLGENYNWSFSIDDPAIVSRVVNVTTIRGSQGLFEAHQAGSTVLHASGDPPCRQSKPACGMPSLIFKIQITVQ